MDNAMNTADKIMHQLQNTVGQRSDLYLIRKWYLPDQQSSTESDSKTAPDDSAQNISADMRQTAYLNFYKRIKPFKIASRQTIQHWFGIGGFAMPSRRQLLCSLPSLGSGRNRTLPSSRFIPMGSPGQ